MLKNLSLQRFGIAVEEWSRLAQLLFLAATLMLGIVLGYTTGTSLFFTKVGAEQMPVFYLLIGLLSFPVYSWFLQVVDRHSRSRLLGYMLLGSIALVLLMRLSIGFDILPAYYGIYIGFYFQWVLIIDIVFPSLVSDYFTALDWKRYVPFLAIALAVGQLLAGSLARLLAAYISSENILLSLPIIYAVAIAQIVHLERCCRAIEASSHELPSGLVESLKTFPQLVRQYPIVFFLAVSPLFTNILYSLGQFQSFTIYSLTFTIDRQLTSFLGLMWVVTSSVELFVIYFFTRPLIQRLAIGQMNLVYPLTTLAAFLALAINFSLPTAIAANINYSPLNKGIEGPVYHLNFNAVPQRLIGRVRTIGGGLFCSVGLSVAGGFLWTAEKVMTQFQISLSGIAIGLLFLLVRYLTGKAYLPADYASEVCHLTASDNSQEALTSWSLPASEQLYIEPCHVPIEAEAAIASDKLSRI